MHAVIGCFFGPPFIVVFFCLFVCLFVRLFVCLFVCLFFKRICDHRRNHNLSNLPEVARRKKVLGGGPNLLSSSTRKRNETE